MIRLRQLCFLLLIVACGCAHRTTVVWISVDAFRGDYLAKFHPPTLSRLAHEGAFTTREVPIFPSLTFPNHTAQATGATVDQHGIPFNEFYDSQTKQTYSYPNTAEQLRAEPLWVTAKRQGLRVGTFNWPLSHGQVGPWKCDYFYEEYGHTDGERLGLVIDALNNDHADRPLRLVMTYVSTLDTIGHRNGPDSPEMAQAVRDTDALLGGFVDSLVNWFDATHSKQDELYILLTADHGMQPVHTLVNLDRLIGIDLVENVKLVTHAPVASVFLDDLPENHRQARTTQILEKLRGVEYLSAWKSNDVPRDFHFSDPSRIGDIFVLLKPGYAFTTLRTATTQPAAIGAASHGFDPAVCPNMLGTAIVWRYHHPMNGIDLGEIRNTQWHATVAHILGITPSRQADPKIIALP